MRWSLGQELLVKLGVQNIAQADFNFREPRFQYDPTVPPDRRRGDRELLHQFSKENGGDLSLPDKRKPIESAYAVWRG